MDAQIKSGRRSRDKPGARKRAIPELTNPEHDTSPTVELHIEELVLRGFAPGDGFRIGDSLERELRRLISEKGLRTSGPVAIDRLDGERIKLASGARAPVVGEQIAQQVYLELSRPPLSRSRAE